MQLQDYYLKVGVAELEYPRLAKHGIRHLRR
jgi:hypothetical protein